jgi:hypothetical protein
MAAALQSKNGGGIADMPGNHLRLDGNDPHRILDIRRSLGEKASSSFLKKRTKKLLSTEASDADRHQSRKNQKFFASFFQKRSAFFSLSE